MRVLLKICGTFMAFAVVTACASRVPRLDYDALDVRPPDEVIRLWEARREVLVRAIKEQKFTLREFGDALQFFEEVTGLPAHQDATRYGPMPNDRLPDDLASWDDWFRENAGRLGASGLEGR